MKTKRIGNIAVIFMCGFAICVFSVVVDSTQVAILGAAMMLSMSILDLEDAAGLGMKAGATSQQSRSSEGPQAEVLRLREVLAEVERKTTGPGGHGCPLCSCPAIDGHDAGCLLAEAFDHSMSVNKGRG